VGSWAIPPHDVIQARCVVLNRESIDRFGGIHSEHPREGCLERSIGAAWTAELYAGEEGAEGLCFIGALMFLIIKNQCFLDGNKRTGLAIALWLLLRFGLTLACTQEEVASFCLAIAGGAIRTREEVVMWLSERIIAIEAEDASTD
jgi:Fic/DOC family